MSTATVTAARAAASVRPAERSDPPAFEMRDVSRRFSGTVALRSVSLEVQQGTILGLIGPSGSGKTTAVRLLTGILAPTKGEVRVLGEEPRRFKRATRERLGYMPQGFLLYPELTASENVDFMASLFGLLFWRRRARVRHVLELLDLWSVRNRQAGDLSGGMQRRLELACALVHDPVALFLDEPTAGLDPLLRRSIWAELHRLRDAGRTMLVTTQFVAEAEECDRVALLSEGRLIAVEAPNDLRRRAYGGDLVEVEADQPLDAGRLADHPAFQGDQAAASSIRQLTPRSVIVVSPDGASAAPALIAAIEAGGAHVVSIREHRPSFDEVFAELVERDRERERTGEPAGSNGVAEIPTPTGAGTA